MPEILEVTDWTEKSYFSTGGTREKSLLESPDGHNFYFKTSLNKPNRDYKFEFWSEIIASEIGEHLGLNILKYNIALKEDKIGCISQSMINSEKERLVEGVNYLIGYNNIYDPQSKEHQPLYSYQYIKVALEYFNLGSFIEHIDQLIVFDALIGNGDRHQENWGVIAGHAPNTVKVKNTSVYQSDNYIKSKLKEMYKAFKERGAEPGTLSTFINLTNEKIRFSPIYDSGSSLAREHSDEKLASILNDNVQFEAYINRGRSEIHWKGEKLRHFELVTELLKGSSKARETINQFTKTFNEDTIRTIINNVDDNVPEQFNEFKLSALRKEFLTKLVTLRYKKIESL